MDSRSCNCKSFIGVSSIFWLIWVSFGGVSGDEFLIDCGSSNTTKLGKRVFLADNSTSRFLSTSQIILAKADSSTVLPSSFDSLYETARILEGVSQYTFPIKKHGRYWIRLYFFPFSSGKYNMSSAKFSVSAQERTTLLKDFQLDSDSVRREYSLNISENQLVLTFTPSSKSFAFINALEVISIPDEVIPEQAESVYPQGDNRNLWKHALETVARVNMGNQSVSPLNDSLGRDWVPDVSFLIHKNFANFTSNITAVNFKAANMSDDIAPAEVYGSLTTLKVAGDDPRSKANMTWFFNVDPGFDYLLRFHFCDILNLPPDSLFNVYVNSGLVSAINVGTVMPYQGAPYYVDAITRVSGSSNLNVSVGIPSGGEFYSPPFLNGLEIMKMSNSEDSLVLDSKSSSKKKLGIVVAACVAGLVVIVLVVAMSVVLLFQRRRNRLHVSHENGKDLSGMSRMDHSNIFSNSKIGYRFPLAVIHEATNNFSEDLVIGVGGFGKVYKGVFRDETKVAVKRGASQSQQGLAEFRTEIEMLSQFRHRHLVSLIGYCHEQNERIIIYEYMENGTLKNHLYGSDDKPSLNWRQRLEACIGAAKGLHYLHTGSTKAIIHRDVKSANILLDEKFMAKVADFGLSKTGPEIDETHVSTAVKGSFGYLDPEYLTTQQLTEKSDIYSFGVVMFEVLCGRPVIDPSLPREKVNLIEWVMNCLERKNLEEIVDARLADQIESDSLQKFVEIAGKCLAEHGSNRPTMGDVLWHLEYALRQEVVSHESSQIRQMNRSDTGLSGAEYTMGSMAGMSEVSMSKVFAQMVRREDMR
ncbi:LOW QUALITY PROTEIN: probable receptor-like protein kinase At2g39360 [Prosopis cineraria]|uniref:LOW QUALITY PROTEIN: probable receptor-like protein kinase At2g39360 n=1 Tax=Prosopis cineraria TaxID=364024 RepID=UPI00240FF171|nr:LOW QUALITY PROTEIN: probable receptor-like protein kinase At2g39360 [Prosopis cineraria]